MNAAKTETAASAANPRALPAGFRPDPVRHGIFAAGILAALALYFFYGTDSEAADGRASVFAWFAKQWGYDDFGNNWIILIVAAFVAWRNRRRIAETPVAPDWRGALVVAASLFAHVVGYRAQMPRISLCSTVGVAWGLVLAVWGRATARAVLFPAAYAMLCFVGPMMVELTMPLRLMASSLACALLQGVGIAAAAHGTVVVSAAGDGFTFDVADACSGLRSLVVMTALAAPYAYFTLRSPLKRVLLFVFSIPLAMVANALRIFTLGVVAEWIGMSLAMQLYHDLSGYIVFFLSLVLLMGTGAILDQDWGAKLCVLKQNKRRRASRR